MLRISDSSKIRRKFRQGKTVVRWFGAIRKEGDVSCSNTLDLSFGKFLKTHINPASCI